MSTAAKSVIAALKNIPGINIGASVLNAAVAGCIVAALGERSVYVFEQIYLGNKSLDDIDWVKKFLESKLSMEFIDKVQAALKNPGNESSAKDIIITIGNIFGEIKELQMLA